MIGFSPLPYSNPTHRLLASNPTTTTATPSLKRLASSRQELERTWHPSASLLPSVTRSRDSLDDDDDDSTEPTFKRQRTLEPSSSSSAAVVVDCHRISPDPPQKAGWYRGPLDHLGNRHGKGHTRHDDGTEYDGFYVRDVMEGWGRYSFTPVRQLVSVPARSAAFQRVTERVWEGNFEKGKPCGRGTIVTTVVDSAMPCAVAAVEDRYVKVTYDVGYYREDGRAVGEGARFAYSKSSCGTEWEEVCTRTWNGECSGVKVGRSYGEWVCDCLNLQSYPEAPSL